MSILSGHETYDALGPFPLGTRELPFLSSPLHAFGSSAAAPVPLTSPVGTSYPSAYGTNGSASWATLRPDDEGWLDVEWAPPLVDWVGLRRTEGWAGLQHLSLLRSEIVVPAAASYVGLLVQGHAWAIVPQDRLEEPVVWHTGDIYAFSESLGGGAKAADVYGQAVRLHAGKHWIYLKVLYEIRTPLSAGLAWTESCERVNLRWMVGLRAPGSPNMPALRRSGRVVSTQRLDREQRGQPTGAYGSRTTP
jgi:hypothetical protein